MAYYAFNPIESSPSSLQSGTSILDVWENNWYAIVERSSSLNSEFVPKHKVQDQQLFLWPEIQKDIKPDLKLSLKNIESEFGCGYFGCVYATNDPNVVFKLTSDVSEARLAHLLAMDALPTRTHVSGVTRYYGAFELHGTYRFKKELRQGNKFYGIWKEAVDPEAVGSENLTKYLGYGWPEEWRKAKDAIFYFRDAGLRIFNMYRNDTINQKKVDASFELYQEGWAGEDNKDRLALNLLNYSSQIRTLMDNEFTQEIGIFVEKLLNKFRVTTGDVHVGNVGITVEDYSEGSTSLVVTDPGLCVFFDPEVRKLSIPKI